MKYLFAAEVIVGLLLVVGVKGMVANDVEPFGRDWALVAN